jgi:predicted PurR-regulated permease PerM
MGTGRSARRFFFILLIAAAVLFGYVVQPIASALFLAATLAGVLWPVHHRLTRLLRGRRNLSAATFVAGLILLVVGPTVAFSTLAIAEGGRSLAFVARIVRSESIGEILGRLPPMVGKPAQRLLDRLPVDDNELTEQLKDKVVAQGGNAAAAVGATLSATGSFLFQATMMLIALYFFLLDGDRLIGWIDDMSPLKHGQTRELLAEFKRVSYAVILSTIITAAVQALAALVGYLIARVPHVLFFTGVTFLVAFIPAIGAGAVCVAVALIMFLTGHPYAALFLAIWGLTVVALVDNLVKPLLIKAGMQMNGAVVFFSLIGGLAAFGGVGLLMGPLIVALLLSLLRMYQRDIKQAVESDGD